MNKPHLCCDADLTKIKFPTMGLPKIDGCRGLHITGRMTGRSLKPHDNLFTTAMFSDAKFAGLDGELTFGDIRSESLCRDTGSVLRRIKGEPDVVWNIFDMVSPATVNLPFLARWMIASDLVAKLNQPNIVMVGYKYLHNQQEVEALYQEHLDEGYEGLILRDPNGLHKDGRATASAGAYLRMKPSSDKEARVKRLVEAMENQNEAKVNALGRTERSSHQENKVGKGMIGMIEMEDCATGLEFNCGPGKMTHAERIYYWQHPEELLDQLGKYRSMDVGVKDAPRFARWICLRNKSDIS